MDIPTELLDIGGSSGIRIKEIEKRIADIAVEKKLSPSSTRSLLWETTCRSILLHRSVETSTVITRLIEEASRIEENYLISNLPMELLRTGLIDRDERFQWLRTQGYAYDPFLSGVQIPSLIDLTDLFRSTDLRETIDSLTDTREGKMTIPQAVPGLGYLIAMKPICNAAQLIDAICHETSTRRRSSKEVTPDNISSIMAKMTKKLMIRIMLIDLTANLERTNPLIKYATSTLAVDARSRGRIIDADLIEALTPFHYPPPIIRRSDGRIIGDIHHFVAPDDESKPVEETVYSSKPIERPIDDKPYVVFGNTGPMFVVLDYGYDDDRYLLLSKSRETVPLPAHMREFTSLGPPSISEDIHILECTRHYRFMAKYIESYGIGIRVLDPLSTLIPKTSDFQFTPVLGSIRFEKPLPGIDLFDAAYAHALAYMNRFIEEIDRNRPSLSTLSRSTSRIRACYRRSFEEKLEFALRTDIDENHVLPFSTGSESEKVIIEFEAYLIGR